MCSAGSAFFFDLWVSADYSTALQGNAPSLGLIPRSMVIILGLTIVSYPKGEIFYCNVDCIENAEAL